MPMPPRIPDTCPTCGATTLRLHCPRPGAGGRTWGACPWAACTTCHTTTDLRTPGRAMPTHPAPPA